MPYDFYSDSEYRNKQSLIAKENWQNGLYNFKIRPLEKRVCKNIDCKKEFKVKPYEEKLFCSQSCSAHIGNLGRKLSLVSRLKISRAILSLPKSYYQRMSVPRVPLKCLACGKIFEVLPYLSKKRKYCSAYCAIRVIGAMTTSPKASKGKPGIRADIDPNINFYSTWEANIARVFNLIDLKWKYAPRIFDLGEHTYRPDFYLPDFNIYIEVKNFMGEYSAMRDRLFRERYPDIKLELLMKDDYLQVKENYKYFIKNWEY